MVREVLGETKKFPTSHASMDSFKSHVRASIRESVRSHYNTHMVVIPGGCTGVLQPADVSWNKPFKLHTGRNMKIGPSMER